MLKIGADPEVFVMNGEGQYVSAYGLFPGNKKNPFPVPAGAIQVDGTAAEFNIDPAESLDQWMVNINQVLAFLRDRVERTGNRIVIDAVAKYDLEYMQSRADVEKVLGCDPDFNAYTLNVNPRPNQHPYMRTAAGHVHIGWDDDCNVHSFDHLALCGDLCRQLDFYLGLPSVVLDKDTERKQMYGKAGAFRPKPYGAEYRVMSNFWLKDEKLMRLVYENTMVGVNSFFVGNVLADKYGDECQDVINTNNVARALELCEEIGIPLEG